MNFRNFLYEVSFNDQKYYLDLSFETKLNNQNWVDLLNAVSGCNPNSSEDFYTVYENAVCIQVFDAEKPSYIDVTSNEFESFLYEGLDYCKQAEEKLKEITGYDDFRIIFKSKEDYISYNDKEISPEDVYVEHLRWS